MVIIKENQTKGKGGTSQKSTKKKVLGNEGEEIQEVHELFKKAYETFIFKKCQGFPFMKQKRKKANLSMEISVKMFKD